MGNLAVFKRNAPLADVKTDTLWKKIVYYRTSYLLMLPFLIFFFLFTLLPLIISIFYSFTYFNMVQPPRWIGWLNFSRLFLDDEVFLIAVKNTLIFGLITGPISYFLCFVFAWFINELKPTIRAFATVVFYAPSIAGSVYFIWSFIFSGDQYGLVNGFLMKLGFLKEPIGWLLDPKYNLQIIILVQLWLSLGTGFLAFIAGLQSIDKSLYEAGAMDGVRNRFQELFYITVPSMYPQLLFGAVMQITASFAVSDICIALAGFPSTNYSAETVVTHIMDYGTIRFEMGYASSIAVILFVAMIVTNQIIKRLMRGISH